MGTTQGICNQKKFWVQDVDFGVCLFSRGCGSLNWWKVEILGRKAYNFQSWLEFVVIRWFFTDSTRGKAAKISPPFGEYIFLFFPATKQANPSLLSNIAMEYPHVLIRKYIFIQGPFQEWTWNVGEVCVFPRNSGKHQDLVPSDERFGRLFNPEEWHLGGNRKQGNFPS